MQIGKVAEETGLSIDTLRYYDRIGLIQPQRQGQRRHYSESDREKLHYIKLLQQASFNLEEIRILFHFEDRYPDMASIQAMPQEDLKQLRNLLANKLASIEVQLEELRNAEDLLQRMCQKLTQIGEGDDASMD